MWREGGREGGEGGREGGEREGGRARCRERRDIERQRDGLREICGERVR